MKTIHILHIESGNEAHALRAAAECWGAEVSVTWVGNSGQIVDYLSARPPHDLILISGHGEPGALLLPELDESVRGRYPYEGRIRADEFREFVQLGGAPVLSLACCTGGAEMADAFLAGGAGAYVGPVDYPDGSAALMFALDFLYGWLVEGRTVAAAHAAASGHQDDRAMFAIHTGDPPNG